MTGFNNGSEGSNNADGGFAGGQIGYRWQAGTWVFGVEAQGDWASFRGSNISAITGDTNRSRLDAFGLFTGQIGYAWNNVLAYVKGGAAVVDNRYDVFDPAGFLLVNSSDRTSWAALLVPASKSALLRTGRWAWNTTISSCRIAPWFSAISPAIGSVRMSTWFRFA